MPARRPRGDDRPPRARDPLHGAPLRARAARARERPRARGRRGRAAARARPSARRRPRSASCARGSSAASARRATCSRASPRAAGTVPYLGAHLELVPAARAHARAPQRRAAAGARRRRRARRSSASTAAPRARRSRRGWIARRALAGTPYSGLDIRAQRTRWASCSASGRMSFNWRLLLAPERVLDYVVWHEVCHLRGARPLAALLGAAGAPLAGLPRGSRLAAAQRRDARCSSAR